MVQQVEWDTEFFNFPVGKVIIDDSNLYLLDELIRTSNFKLTYFFSDIPLSRNQLKHVDTKIVYKRNITETIFSNTVSNLIIKPFEEGVHSYSKLLELVYLSGNFSRYKTDPDFSNQEFEKLYKIWLDNSIAKVVADELFVATLENNPKEPVGFITLKFDKSISTIGLIAVDNSIQNSGIGKQLINVSLDAAAKKKINHIQVATQEKNKQASLFYEKCHFECVSKTYIYHLWK